jgi:hypothetical protein
MPLAEVLARRRAQKLAGQTVWGEAARRQKPVSDGTIVAVADAAQIRTGPFEQIAFTQHDPGAFGIETEMLFDGGWQFQSFGEIGGWAVDDGNDQDFGYDRHGRARRGRLRKADLWCLPRALHDVRAARD